MELRGAGGGAGEGGDVRTWGLGQAPAGSPNVAVVIDLMWPNPAGHASAHGGPPSHAQQHTFTPRWDNAVG